jgi:hypothetical protein
MVKFLLSSLLKFAELPDETAVLNYIICAGVLLTDVDAS